MKTEQMIEEANKIAQHFSFGSDSLSNRRYVFMQLVVERLKEQAEIIGDYKQYMMKEKGNSW